ncbi:MAG TPA: NADP-dependent isocitrate dehydrogenase [Alphaproteobacteria bacterium]|nr:NADP-dependent isocitrate dehydrogenase [Alphaproteobacteria bacterium]
MTKAVTLIEGDGVGPEIVQAVQRVINATGVKIQWEVCEAGAKVFKKGLATGVPQETIDSLKRTKVALKGPLETPVGYGEKSANVTLRALFETYANTRPVRQIPGILTPFSGRAIDFVIVRENVEDLYTGIEYLQTPNVAEGLKLITRKGSEKIIRFAFELARSEGRRKVHCATKANILKLTEGLFKKTFEEVAKDYPDIEAQHIIIDNCAHQMVLHPESFDVIVTTNLQGDIISDLGSALVGGLGVAASANIGDEFSIFEAVHGSAPDIAGKNIVNPTALLFSAAMMLRHLNEFAAASRIEQSLLFTLGTERAFPKDLDKSSTLTTTGFTDIIIRNLDEKTDFWTHRPYKLLHLPQVKNPTENVPRKEVGVDIYIESTLSPEALGKSLEDIALSSSFFLKMVANRGTQVYPAIAGLKPDTVDHWRARFFLKNNELGMDDKDILKLIEKIGLTHRWMHIEKLNEFNHALGFTKAQGES